VLRYIQGTLSCGLKYDKTEAMGKEATNYVTQSFAEAEYISAVLATHQTSLLLYNKSIILMSKNPVYQERIKHIVIKHHFIQKANEEDEVKLDFN